MQDEKAAAIEAAEHVVGRLYGRSRGTILSADAHKIALRWHVAVKTERAPKPVVLIATASQRHRSRILEVEDILALSALKASKVNDNNRAVARWTDAKVIQRAKETLAALGWEYGRLSKPIEKPYVICDDGSQRKLIGVRFYDPKSAASPPRDTVELSFDPASGALLKLTSAKGQ